MDFKRILTALTAVSMALAVFSCKEKEEEVDYKSLVGTPDFTVPTYTQPGDVITVEVEEVSKDADSEDISGIGYYWTVSPVKTDRDTIRTENDPASVKPVFTFTVPDTLCTLTFTCSAYAEGYTTSSKSVSSVIVKPHGEGKSLQGIKYQDENKYVTDSRDGKKYMYTSIAGLDWFCENLAYEEAGLPFFNSKAMTDIFGMYYTWDEAVNACPDGWRLPANADFLTLHNSLTKADAKDALATFKGKAGDLMADAYLNDVKLWEFWPEVDINNSTCLSLIPTGFAINTDEGDNATFTGSMKYFSCWTNEAANEEKSYYRYIYCDKPDILLGAGDKASFASPVRCVRETE